MSAASSSVSPYSQVRGFLTGTVVIFRALKHFGFLLHEATQEQIYFHQNDIQNPLNSLLLPVLQPGQRVHFNIIHGPQGSQAVDIGLENGQDVARLHPLVINHQRSMKWRKAEEKIQSICFEKDEKKIEKRRLLEDNVLRLKTAGIIRKKTNVW